MKGIVKCFEGGVRNGGHSEEVISGGAICQTLLSDKITVEHFIAFWQDSLSIFS